MQDLWIWRSDCMLRSKIPLFLHVYRALKIWSTTALLTSSWLPSLTVWLRPLSPSPFSLPPCAWDLFHVIIGVCAQMPFLQRCLPEHSLKRVPLPPACLRSYPALAYFYCLQGPEIIFLYIFLLILSVSPTRIEALQRQPRHLPCSFLSLGLAHSRCSVNICWMNCSTYHL